jgi:hypothetical protein
MQRESTYPARSAAERATVAVAEELKSGRARLLKSQGATLISAVNGFAQSALARIVQKFRRRHLTSWDALNRAGYQRGRYTRLAMSPLLLPFQLFRLMFAVWVNRHQLDVIEYLQEENRVLKERLGG